MFAGFDIGGTNIKAVLTNDNGAVQYYKKIETPNSANDIVTCVSILVKSLAKTASQPLSSIKGIGIGTAGTINKKAGTIISGVNIPGFNNFPIVSKVQKFLNIPVTIENDATTALMGCISRGYSSGLNNWILLTLGTGVGAGFVFNGNIFTGQNGNSMEVGHMCINFHGPECPCGSNGCFELYTSVSSLIENAIGLIAKGIPSSLYDRMNSEPLSSKIIYEEAVKKDEVACSIFSKFAHYLGIGISNLINIFNPEAIILSGGLSQAHKCYLAETQKVIASRVLNGFKNKCRIIPVSENDYRLLPPIGAAIAAINAYGNS
jgi:glucokinase